MLTSRFHTLSKLGVLAATLSFAAPVPNATRPFTVYYESTVVEFAPEASTSHHMAALGPWTLGERLREDKPLDKRLNLYVVVPGMQYRSPVRPEYDHSLIVNSLTHEKPREWDVFWCFILDARLTDDLRSEKELLTAAQQSFQPADLFDIEDIPGHEVLSEKSGIQTLDGLNRYRHKDGSLPRILILPAHMALRATAETPEETGKPESAETTE